MTILTMAQTHWLPTVALYLHDRDCRELLSAAGTRAIGHERRICMFRDEHKRRMHHTFALIKTAKAAYVVYPPHNGKRYCVEARYERPCDGGVKIRYSLLKFRGRTSLGLHCNCLGTICECEGTRHTYGQIFTDYCETSCPCSRKYNAWPQIYMGVPRLCHAGTRTLP
jgi:hypothetical protein